jgi:hypothetical protein
MVTHLSSQRNSKKEFLKTETTERRKSSTKSCKKVFPKPKATVARKKRPYLHKG